MNPDYRQAVRFAIGRAIKREEEQKALVATPHDRPSQLRAYHDGYIDGLKMALKIFEDPEIY